MMSLFSIVRFTGIHQEKTRHMVTDCFLKNKTNHPIVSNSHPSATANKAIHCSNEGGGGVKNQREHLQI